MPDTTWRDHRRTQFEGPLTAREVAVARLAAEGLSNKEIAERLGIALDTVKNTFTHIFAKTRCRSRTEVAVRLVTGNLTTEGG